MGNRNSYTTVPLVTQQTNDYTEWLKYKESNIKYYIKDLKLQKTKEFGLVLQFFFRSSLPSFKNKYDFPRHLISIINQYGTFYEQIEVLDLFDKHKKLDIGVKKIVQNYVEKCDRKMLSADVKQVNKLIASYKATWKCFFFIYENNESI